MPTFLVSIPITPYVHYICARDGIPLPDGSTDFTPEIISLYIRADTEEAALEWAKYIGDRYSKVIEDVPDWKERNLLPFIQRNPEEAGLTGLDSFLQEVRVGEEPRYEGMTNRAYVQWLEDNWRET